MAMAVARPIPELAPVTSAILSDKEVMRKKLD
jgi:hypothetical protein